MFGALLGACTGLVGGIFGGLLVTRGPADSGARDAAAGSLEARARRAMDLEQIVARVEQLERGVRESPGAASSALKPTIEGLAEDLQRLRDAVVRDTAALEGRIWDLERRVDELTAVAALLPPTTGRPGPPTEEEEGKWVTLARDEAAGKRFSALVVLGRARTDRSVQASVRALRDPDEKVRWQGVRNLGQFDERAHAAAIAELLADERVTVRSAAHDALVKLGAPETGFDPAAPAERRRAPAERLRAWADEAQ